MREEELENLTVTGCMKAESNKVDKFEQLDKDKENKKRHKNMKNHS